MAGCIDRCTLLGSSLETEMRCVGDGAALANARREREQANDLLKEGKDSSNALRVNRRHRRGSLAITSIIHLR